MANTLPIIHVQIHVRADAVEAFKTATLANVRGSLQEPGVIRFDFVQDRDDPTRFVLLEVYRDAAAVAAHKETAHYQTWRDTVNPLMAETRTSRKFVNVHPDDADF